MVIPFYRFLKSNGLRGRGLWVRFIARCHPLAARFPFSVEGLGTFHADLRLGSVLPLFDYAVGDLGHCTRLAAAMARFLKPGDRLWDIGANIGTIALHFARSQFGLTGIDVFEPNPDLAANLRMMSEKIPAVKVHMVALGAQAGEAQLHLNRHNDTCTASLFHSFPDQREVSVKVATGDAIWRESQQPAPSVIKIDVEGFEPQVFTGLQSLIGAARPVIFFEHLFLSNDQIRGLIPPGYTWVLILENGTLTSDEARRQEAHDSILVPVEQLGKLPKTV